MANPNYWYSRHFKDYAEKTAHLSLIEHGAYTLLLDHYYQTRGRLMANAVSLLRVCRAQTDDEKVAVQSVLDQFFTIGDDGMYHNKRADKEMGIAGKISAARSLAGKAGASKRWNDGNDMANGTANDIAKPTLIIRQNNTQSQQQPQVSKPLSENSDVAQILNCLNERAGTKYRHVKANTTLIAARLQEGATIEDCKAVIDSKVKAWGNDPKMSEYLRPATLFNATKFAQYVGELGTRVREVPPWERT